MSEAEQAQTIAEIKGRVKSGLDKWAIGAGQWINDLEMLLDIIEARSKKYSADELYEAWLRDPAADGHGAHEVLTWCAAFVGALKSATESK